MDERAAERELLFHAARQRRGAAILERLELRVDRRDAIAFPLDGRAEHRREEAQVLLDAEIAVEREASGHVADARPQRPESPDDVLAEDVADPRSGMSSVARIRNSVVLPAPSGPMKPKSSPACTAHDTSSSAMVWPNCLTTPLTTTASVIS